MKNYMILSDGEIRKALEDKHIEIYGHSELYIGPSSVDLHMSDVVKQLKHGSEIINLSYTKMEDLFEERNIGSTGITIYPGEFYLMSTAETVKFPSDISGFVQGRSSLARLGIKIHDAGFVDAGFKGTITLEVTNLTMRAVQIPPDSRICQIVFVKSEKSSEVPYNMKKDNKYNEQEGPTVTRINRDYNA